MAAGVCRVAAGEWAVGIVGTAPANGVATRGVRAVGGSETKLSTSPSALASPQTLISSKTLIPIKTPKTLIPFKTLSPLKTPKILRPLPACHASFQDDLPLVAAMGACLVVSGIPLIFPTKGRGEDGEKRNEIEREIVLGSSEVRYGAMTVIGFIPLFNWLTWIFAYLDTREIRYLIFGIVYAAPYLKTGLSLSPDDSWVPLLSVFLCGVHVQFDKFAEDSEPLLKTAPDWSKKLSIREITKALSSLNPNSNSQEKRREEEEEAARRSLEETKWEMRQWDKKFKQTERNGSKDPESDK